MLGQFSLSMHASLVPITSHPEKVTLTYEMFPFLIHKIHNTTIDRLKTPTRCQQIISFLHFDYL